MKKILIILLVLIILSPLCLLAIIILNFGRTPPQTYLLQHDYSRLNQSQIVSRLSQDQVLPPNLNLQNQQQIITLDLASISAQIDKNQTAGLLLYSHYNQGIIPYFLNYFRPKMYLPKVTWDETRLDGFLSSLASPSARPFIPTEIQLNQKNISTKKGQLGQTLDISTLRRQIIYALTSNKFDPIALPFQTTGFLPTDSQITATENKAKSLLDKSLLLKHESIQITVDGKTLISWLDYQNNYQTDKIVTFVDGLAKSLAKDPVDASFKFENGRVLEFQPSSPGLSLQSLILISQLPRSIEELSSSSDKTKEIAIPFETIPAAVATSDVNSLGIHTLLGKGTSTFKHSNATRNFNIEKGASIINRILVPPGATFSFVKNLGEVTLETGFKKAYIIRQGKTELDVGGGICQVSTTLFRAMLNAGVEILERQPHAYRVGYYEEDSPPGYDATVFIPSPDLKFKNDTPAHILIQSVFDAKNKRLTYEIYGTSDGRQIEISNYRKWGYQDPPPDRYVDDPTLPPGKVIQDEHRIAGLKTAFDWKVTRDGQTLRQKTFQSSYVPWAAVYRRGIQP